MIAQWHIFASAVCLPAVSPVLTSDMISKLRQLWHQNNYAVIHHSPGYNMDIVGLSVMLITQNYNKLLPTKNMSYQNLYWCILCMKSNYFKSFYGLHMRVVTGDKKPGKFFSRLNILRIRLWCWECIQTQHYLFTCGRLWKRNVYWQNIELPVV